MPRFGGKLSDKQVSAILIFCVLGLIIVGVGWVLYDYEKLEFSFWTLETYVTYPYRDEAPFVMIAGAVIAVAGVAFSFFLPSTTGREETPSVRVCLGCGYPLPKNVKFCPRCGKTVESITVQSAHKHIH